MNSKTMFLSLIPWAVFTIAASHGGTGFVAPAALVAAVLAGGVALYNTRRTGFTLIDGAGVATFTAMSAIAFAADDSGRHHIVDYGRGIAALILASVMLGSVLFVPFTEQYARAGTPRQYWDSPVFRAVNRRLSALWGGAILVMAGSHLLSGHLQAAGELTRRENLGLNWALPVLLVLGAMRLTARVVGESKDKPAVESPAG